jgi:hypothetical protein
MITPFRADVDDERMKTISYQMVNHPFLLSDEVRNYDFAWRYLFDVVCAGKVQFYGIEDDKGPIKGLLAVTSIVPGHKAEMIFWAWDYTIFDNNEFLGEMNEFLEKQMLKYAIHRLSYETSDAELAQRLSDLGFKIEGRQKYAFMKNEKMITNFLLRKIKEI